MIDLHCLDDLELLRESIDLECKLAAGRDGQGALPEDFWPTYSAFANTNGGVVLFGVREKKGQFTLEGIANPARLRKELFDSLNNRQKVSCNLLTDSSMQEIKLEGKTLLVLEIPRARRKQRPIYLKANPLGNTYRRGNEADQRIDDEDVKRMLAEQLEDSRDDRVLSGYDLSDLCLETYRAYRQVFSNRDSAHPWSTLDDHEFLRQIGGWRKDRETGDTGLTVAGLLMFGWMTPIQEALPNYMLDYQERPEAKTELRWLDRITLDGKWSGNLYDFYRKVYLKLTADLKVPFALEKGERKDETPIHVALREALANVLVHADYSDRASVLVVKRPDMFGFRNPGLMRVPPDIAIRGGEHDCRNRTLHKMFRLIGVGEQAGSGLPKIYDGWNGQHWRTPALYERSVPYNQTILELRMIDLLPEELLAALRRQFGLGFASLQRNERLTLATAASERIVSHARVIEMTGLHPVEASRLLQGLVRSGYLETHNPGRGAVYCLPGAAPPTPEEVFGEVSGSIPGSSTHLTDRSTHLTDRSTHLLDSENETTSPAQPQRDSEGRLLSSQLDAPIVDSLQQLTSECRNNLAGTAKLPMTKPKIGQDEMRDVLLNLCRGHYVTGTVLAALVNRDAKALQQNHLRPLVQQGKLKFAFPTAPTHEMQAYRSMR